MENKKVVLVPVADGAEEIETVTIVDVLRRAEINVILSSVMGKLPGSTIPPIIKGSRGIGLVCDEYFEDSEHNEYDIIVLPGGLENSKRLAECTNLIKKLKSQKERSKYYAAICASPALVLEPHGLLEGHSATCFPTLSDKLKNQEDVEKRVVVSNNCITSRSPGTAMEFSLKLVEILKS